ncbi:MAG: tetratricopeptide repeat protein, partial [Rhodospirillales bacterium]|nr:tetratricopeptide repeat protein [Rhodospirillales bacterium]
LNPDYAEAHASLGNALKEMDRLEAAVASYRKAIALDPDLSGAHTNLGNMLKETGLVDDAIASHRKAIALNPDFAEAHYNLGNVLKEAGRLEDAEASYEKAIRLKPDLAEAHSNLGSVRQEQGRLDEAMARLHKALAAKPDYADAHRNLGDVIKDLGRLEDAVASYHKALTIKPDYAEAHSNLGNAYVRLGETDGAIDYYRQALDINPAHATAITNLGNVLMDKGQHDDALAHHRRAIEAAPDHAEAHHNLSLVLLLQGKLEEGWAEYEWRLRSEKGARHRPFPQAPWVGQPVDAKTVLVWGEQGVGDEVMFAGMVPDLVEAGAHIVLESDPRLVPLFERSFAGIACIGKGDPPTAETRRDGIDFQSPGGNLGRWLRPNLESFPGRQSYLVAEEDRQGRLRENYLSDGESLLVGVAWVSKNKRIGAQKSMTLMELAPLTGIPGVRFIDLQYGDTAEERRQFEDHTGTTILHDEHVDQMSDLDAFAAQVAAMDLVISVSNTTVHMSGALGVPTWVMLNTVPLPCWLLERDDSPWYPSVRLFRQSAGGDWANVTERTCDALRAFAG